MLYGNKGDEYKSLLMRCRSIGTGIPDDLSIQGCSIYFHETYVIGQVQQQRVALICIDPSLILTLLLLHS